MNFEETKFVTVDDKGNIQLFFLPYALKCEMSIDFEEMLGFKITLIAFSYNEKLVIVGDENHLAVAEIENIESFFKLDMDEVNQRFTVLTVEEKIDKIVIVSNNDLIVIEQSYHSFIYNLGRFDFDLKFKDLKEQEGEISLKKDFGEVVVTNLVNNSSIEQYGNMIFSTNNEKL